MRRSSTPSPPTAQETAEKHRAKLLLAMEGAHPVLYQGRLRFIHTLHIQQMGGGLDSIIYLTGSPTPVTASEIKLQEKAP